MIKILKGSKREDTLFSILLNLNSTRAVTKNIGGGRGPNDCAKNNTNTKFIRNILIPGTSPLGPTLVIALILTFDFKNMPAHSWLYS